MGLTGAPRRIRFAGTALRVARLMDRARSRAGFAPEAVRAGERSAGRIGVLEYADLLAEIEKEAS